MARLTRRIRPGLAKGEDAKLLVLLHGLGSDENDMVGAAEALDPELTVCALRAPHPYEFGGYAWFGLEIGPTGIGYEAVQALESRDLLDSELRLLADELAIPPSRTVIGGFSQGAMMSCGLILADHARFAGALLMSGGLLPEFAQKAPSESPKSRILIQHGRLDQVVPTKIGREMRDSLVSFGFEVEYKEYPMGHSVSPRSLADAANWLDSVWKP